jgi:hypothetical protein
MLCSTIMRRHGGLALLTLTMMLAVSWTPALGSTPEERKWAVDTARWLEENPLSPEAKAKAAELLKWWISVPDLSVSPCPLFSM